MLGKRSRPMIGKLPDHPAIPDLITSPKSPLDFKIRSPRNNNGFKNCVAGVGLGIVAALEKSPGAPADGQTPAKFILGSLNLNRSEPIPIGSANKTSFLKNKKSIDDDEFCEDYTCVISHRGPNNKPITRVFFDGDEFSCDSGGWRLSGQCCGPPAVVEEVAPAYPTSSFLSSCYLCRKTLHGRDIFMYRGEKAFCSSECRYKQIVSDERKEKCRSEASRSTAADISASPYSGGQLFSTGIIAA